MLCDGFAVSAPDWIDCFFPSENLNFAFVLLVLCPWLVISYWLWKNRPGSYRKWSAASKISMVSGLAYFILT